MAFLRTCVIKQALPEKGLADSACPRARTVPRWTLSMSWSLAALSRSQHLVLQMQGDPQRQEGRKDVCAFKAVLLQQEPACFHSDSSAPETFIYVEI